MSDESAHPSGLLDFFVLEAGDYLEQLDATLSRAAAEGPDAEALLRTARALRGSATMSRLAEFSELAGAFERVARGVRDGAVPWSPPVGGALVAAVDDMKLLLHRVRSWGEPEKERARARTAELATLAPEQRARRTVEQTLASGTEYIAGELSNLGAGLELLLTSPAAAAGFEQVLQRVRTLRGVAGIKDLPRLPEVLDAAERALEGAGRGARSAAETGRGLLEASSEVLRDLSTALREGRPPSIREAIGSRFEEAFEAWETSEGSADRVVPIESLYFDDGGETVVRASAAPPSSPRDRFVVELVGRSEHLRQVVADARASVAGGDAARALRPIRSALRSLRQTAESFSETQFAAGIAALSSELSGLDERLLDRLDGVAAALVARGPDPSILAAEPERHAEAPGARTGFETGEVEAVGEPAAEPEAPDREIPEDRSAEPLAEPVSELAGDEPTFESEPLPEIGTPTLQEMLERSIGSLDALGDTPLADAAPPAEVAVIPIESLVYRGRAALDRAAEVREEIASSGGTPAAEQLEELFDLIDLARVG